MKNSKWDIPHRGYNFNKDLAFGKQGEKLVQLFLNSLDQTAFEVKTDRYRNGRMCIEIEQNPMRRVDENGEQVWVKSGLMVTKANWWVYVYTLNGEHGAFVTVSVKRLKKYIRKNRKRLVLMDFAKRSDNPSRGYLVEPLEVMDMLINPEYDE
jgi:hypothetical protein